MRVSTSDQNGVCWQTGFRGDAPTNLVGLRGSDQAKLRRDDEDGVSVRSHREGPGVDPIGDRRRHAGARAVAHEGHAELRGDVDSRRARQDQDPLPSTCFSGDFGHSSLYGQLHTRRRMIDRMRRGVLMGTPRSSWGMPLFVAALLAVATHAHGGALGGQLFALEPAVAASDLRSVLPGAAATEQSNFLLPELDRSTWPTEASDSSLTIVTGRVPRNGTLSGALRGS